MRGVCFAVPTAAAWLSIATAMPSMTFRPLSQGLNHGPRFLIRAANASTLITTASDPTATDCGQNCDIRLPLVSSIDWVKGLPYEIVVATIILTINNQTNTTSTSTKTNDITSLLLNNTLFPPNPTNVDGTIVTTVTLSGRTTVLAYPTVVADYESSYTVAGTISVELTDGDYTCRVVGGGDPARISTVAPTLLPSHPPLTLPPQAILDDDPKGIFKIPRWSTDFFPKDYMTSLFPEIPAFTGCDVTGAAPEAFLNIASFLTETSVNFVSAPASQSSATSTIPPAQSALTTPQSAVTIPGAAVAPAITLGSATFTPSGPNGTTLVAGPAVTVSGTRVSLALGSIAAVVGSSTTLLPAITGGGSAAAVLTLYGTTYTANSAGNYIIGSQTLVPDGPKITVSGTQVSLAPGGTAAVVVLSTVPLDTGVEGTGASKTKTPSSGAERYGGSSAVVMAMISGILGMMRIPV